LGTVPAAGTVLVLYRLPVRC